jgi:hypothetical protein
VRKKQLIDIHNRIADYQKKLDKESDMFKQMVANKAEDISANLIRSVLAIYVDNFLKSLSKLDTWVDENLQNLQQGTKISVFFRNLDKKVERYFSYTNACIINSWFTFRQYVPHDWHTRLFGFGRSGQYWLEAEYEILELEKNISKENITFSEFANILDFCLKESFESCIGPNKFKSKARKNLVYLRNVTRIVKSKSFSQFFENWKQIECIQFNFTEKLQAKYEQNFKNVSFESVQLSFSNGIKRVILFVIENINLMPSRSSSFEDREALKVQAIHNQLQYHASNLYGKFKKNSIDRIIHYMIQHETPEIGGVLDRLSNVLIEGLKLQNAEFSVWQISQPYKKILSLKYSLPRYEDFFREIKVIFASNHLDVPKEELEYLELVQFKFDHLQKQAEMSSFEGSIDTRWNWGIGFIRDEIDIKNVGVTLRLPISYGIVRAKSGTLMGSFSSLDGNFVILLLWSLIFVFKVIKLNLKT